jgi:ribosomal protein S18 acetylase RimI-like enzyme
MSFDLIIRPAQAADRDAVLDFTRTIWEGRDYIGYVWDDWLAATDGPLLVGAVDDRAVALVKLSDLGGGEGWIHGVRVAEAMRGRGIAQALIAHCVRLSRQLGYHSLRLMTGEDNYAMQ